MIRPLHIWWLTTASLALCAPSAAQSLQFQFQQATTATPAADGSTVTIKADGAGKLASATVTVTYSGASTATISDIRISGAADMTLANVPALPKTLTAGQSLSFEARFLPATTSRVVSAVVVQYSEASAAKQATLNVAGVVADLTFGYILPSDNNYNPLSSGGRVLFPAAGVNSTTVAAIVISNRGSGPTAVNAVTISGASFQLQGIPFLPVSLDAGGTFRFNVAFAPRQNGVSSGTLQVGLPDRTVPFALEGSTAAPDFNVSYFLQNDNNTYTLTTGGRISYPTTNINSTSTATIILSNRSGGGGYVNSISLSGANFLLNGIPALPAFLDVGKEIRFGLTFAPKQPGVSTGVLQIAFADRVVLVNLDGTTATPDFSISYSLGNSNLIAATSVISFPATALNSSNSATIVVANRGGGGYLNTISLVGVAFASSGLPSLPYYLDSGKDVRFTVIFTPRQTGYSTGILQMGFSDRSVTINLEGNSASPDFLLSYFLPNDGNNLPLFSGSQLTFPSTSILSSTTVTVVVTNRGTGSGAVNSISAAGTSFRLTSIPLLPATLDAGKELRFGVVFAPTKAGVDSGVLTLAFADRTMIIQLTGNTAAPEFRVSYFIQTDGNGVFVDSGGKIAFPSTKVNTNSTAVISLSNYGYGAGYVNSITMTGQAFQLTSVAALPILVGSAKELRFAIVYSPTRLENSAGALQIVIDDKTITLEVTGNSTGAAFTYTILSNGVGSPFFPKDTISVPDTTLRDTTITTMQVKNAGNADGAIPSIVVSGQGYQLTNLPILPVTLAPNAIIQFSLVFSPTQAGTANGRLQIGADAFDLIGNGNGPKLLYSYIGGSGAVAIQETKTVLWGRVEAGQTSQVLFVIRNDGTSAAAISSAAIVDAKSAFRIVNPPEFPAALAAGAQLTLSITFSPTALGDNTARLRVDGDLFTLLGAGTAPPALPAFELRGLSPTLDTLQQPALSLTLAAPYPLPLTGTLQLTVNSRSFVLDPAVQFASGGKSVNFTIPANSTKALFPSGPEIRLQTGTVAATLSVTATFATESGIAITPESAPVTNYEIPEASPRLLDFQIDSRSSTGFTLLATGLSATRSLKQLELNFTGSTNYNVPNSRFSLSVESASAAWYRSAESQTYGSLFTVKIPFTLQGLDASKTLDQVFQSISATLTNDKGQSNTISVKP